MVDWNKKAERPISNRWGDALHEKRHNKIVGRKIGGDLTPASGAKSGAKGDRELDGNIKIEQKSTDASSISIRHKFLEKIHIEARQQGKDPALIFSFLKEKGHTPKDWIAIPLDVFKQYYDFLKDNGYGF